MNLLKKNTKNLIFSSLFLFSSSSVQAETPILDMEMAIIVQSAFNRCMLEEKVLTKEQAITMNRGGAAVTPELFNPVLKIIENGGWHFTNLKSAEEIEHKLRSYLHHREFDVNPISINEIKNIIKNKIAIYDLTLDKRTQKIGHGKKLEKYPLDRLPKFLQDNLNNYQEWID